MVTLSGVVASSDKVQGGCQQGADPAKCWFIYTFQRMPSACTVLYALRGEGGGRSEGEPCDEKDTL